MGARSRLKFSPQFKAEVVQLVVQSGRSIAEVAGELDLNAGTLDNWLQTRREDHPKPESGSSPVDHGQLAALEEQNRALKMENEFF